MYSKNKILFAGLDNCGKTSFIKTVQHKFPFTSSNPTIGLNRSCLTSTPCLGLEFIAWDLAGQKQYRDQYFFREKLIFLNASTLYYLIDVQEEERFTESLQYLSKILTIYKQNNFFPKIIICLHKLDPEIEHNKQKIGNIKRKLIPNLIQYLKNLTYFIYFTSIHDISNLLRVFSRGIIDCHPKSDMIQSFLQKYLQMTFSASVVLFTKELLLIGESSINDLYLQTCYAATPRFVIAMEKIQTYNLESKKVVMNIAFDKNNPSNSINHPNEGLLFLIPLPISESETFYLKKLQIIRNFF